MILTPSAINKYLKSIIESDSHLKVVSVKGELSNVKYHSSGTIYFSIKDSEAQINCSMFSNFAKNLSEKFIEGDEVELIGSIYLYVKGGSYSINVKDMKKSGVGDLSAKFNELKLKLEKKGLFDQSNKKNLPKFPKKIGIITAKTGAAVEDILITLKNRYPIAKITVYNTLVQGPNAKSSIVNNLKYADKDNNDVIIVGRGGGSIEDLWAFNEEIVANTIFELSTPVISSVGHETDTTIADYVADKRAATPTAAATMVTPDILNIKDNITKNINTITNLTNNTIKNCKLKLSNIASNQYFLNPLTSKQLLFDQLQNNFNNIITTHQNKLEALNNDIIKMTQLSELLIKDKLKNKETKINNIHNQLDILNPLTILSRGYSVVSQENKLIKSLADIDDTKRLSIKVSDGVVNTNVINKEKDNG